MSGRIFALGLMLASLARAQGPAFEVATIKLADAGDYLSIDTEGGTARYTHLTLRILIAIATGVDNSRVVGGPSWLDNQHYDVVGKLPAGATKSDIPAMLNKLLQERMKVVVHRESKEQNVLALVVGKGGAKLTRSDDNSGGGGTIMPDGMKVRGATMASLARMLKRPAGMEVVDRTGIEGVYDIEMKWRKDENSDGPAFITALQEQLGLKLEPAHATVDTIVVDSAERVPIEN